MNTKTFLKTLLSVAALTAAADLFAAPDVTGLQPFARIADDGAALALVTEGVRIEHGSDWTFIDEDFAVSPRRDDRLRLEPFAGAYAHPQFAPSNRVTTLQGFSLSLSGDFRGVDGPLVALGFGDLSTGALASMFTVEEKTVAGKDLVFLRRFLPAVPDAEDLLVVTNELGLAEENRHYLVTWKDNSLSFSVNGECVGRCTTAAFAGLSLGSVRLGERLTAFETEDLVSNDCGAFDLADLRLYDRALDEIQTERLSRYLRGEVVQVSAVSDEADPPKTTYTNAHLRIGAPYGAVAELVPREDGLAFTGWTLDTVGGPSVTSATLVTNAEPHRLVANWTNLVYGVTYDFCGYPLAENETRAVVRGAAYDPPTGFEVEGCPFDCWTNAWGQVVGATNFFPVSGTCADETLYAVFTASHGTLRFDPMNGGSVTSVVAEVNDFVALYRPEEDPIRTGYSFADWWSEPAGGRRLTDETRFTNPRGETWYAHWNGLPQRVRWTYDDGRGPVELTTERNPSGGVYELPTTIPEVEGRLFYSWIRSAEQGGWAEIAHWDRSLSSWSTNLEVTVQAGEHAAFAMWWYACALDPQGGTFAIGDPTNTYLRVGVSAGAWRSLPSPIRTGYDFLGWSTAPVGGEPIVNATIIAVDSEDPRSDEGVPRTLYAQWRAAAVKVTLDANGGTVSPDAVLVSYQEAYDELPVPVRPGYALESWHFVTEGGNPVNVRTVVESLGDHRLVASWTNAVYHVRYVRDGETIEGHDFHQTFDAPWPALLDLSSEMKVDEAFVGWHLNSPDGPLVRSGDLATNLTADCVLVAKVGGVIDRLSLDPNGGALDAHERTILVESGKTITGLPEDLKRAGCAFLGWYESCDQEITNGYVRKCVGDATLTAMWKGTNQINLVFNYATQAGRTGPTTNVIAYYLTVWPAAPKVDGMKPTDDAVFLGWWNGEVQCYDATNGVLEISELYPYETDQMMIARWGGGRDSFVRAFRPSAGATNRVVSLQGTDEPGEPLHDGFGDLRATHWYRFGAKAGDIVTVSFRDYSGSDWPAFALAMYSGSDIGSLTEVASRVEYDQTENYLTVPIAEDGVYHLAVAQASEGAALCDYELVIDGFTGTVSSDVVVPKETTGSVDILIPASWFERYPDFQSCYGWDNATAVYSLTGKTMADGTPMQVWQDYVTGTDPTDVTDVLKTLIAMEGAVPSVDWTPNLNTNGDVRIYRILGKRTLSVSEDWEPAAPEHRFFEVRVDMPTQDAVSDRPGPIVKKSN